MYIRSLPRSRRSRNRRRNGRWIRCAILERHWVAPNAAIGLYLLDDKRREVQRARDRSGEAITFRASCSPSELARVVDHLGEGLYRLVARDPAGRILARRDFAAARWSMPEVGARQYAPRTQVESLKAELVEARRLGESARAERDALGAEVEALKAALTERAAAIEALEGEVERRAELLDRARRLYAQMGPGPAADGHPKAEGEHEGAGDEDQRPRARRRLRQRARREHRAPEPERRAHRGGLGVGLDLHTFERACAIVARHMGEMSARRSEAGGARNEPDAASDGLPP